MSAAVERCDSCGQYVYRLRLWISDTDILIDAGPRKAFVIDEVIGSLHDVPVMKLTEEIPSEVFVRHDCEVKP